MKSFIQPTWPAPDNIRAYTTTRIGGVSLAPYHEFNLGEHVEDNPLHVSTNRDLLKKRLELSNDPIWIKQTHSTIALEATPENREQEADATFTRQKNIACLVMTADCLPILLCNQQGTEVAAIHAGWRGLAHGVIESTIQALTTPHQEILAWLGPAISLRHFEVGDEVRAAFLKITPKAEDAFTPSPNQRWLADLYLLARIRLQNQGITQIYGGEYCTFSDKEQFYSYRRDGEKTGRMASLIWINE